MRTAGAWHCDVPLTELRFRCSNCGSDRTDLVFLPASGCGACCVSGRRHSLDSTAYRPETEGWRPRVLRLAPLTTAADCRATSDAGRDAVGNWRCSAAEGCGGHQMRPRAGGGAGRVSGRRGGG